MPPLTIKDLILQKIEARIKEKQSQYADAFIDANLGKDKVAKANAGLKTIRKEIEDLEQLALKVRENKTNE